MKVFITGGTGLVGRALTRALLERGDEVVCITRDRRRALARLPRPVTVVEADPTQSGVWQEVAGECDAIVNLAGESLAAGRWTRKRKAAFRHSRLGTTRQVAAVADASETVKTLISASAVGFYGGADRSPLYEEFGAGNDYLSKLAHEWEGRALDADITRTRVILLRIGVVFDRDDGALPRIVKPFMMGFGAPLGDPKAYVPWIHRHDLIRIILFLLDNDAVKGPVNAVAPDPPTQKELAEALGRVLDKPVRPPVPAWVLRLLLGEMADLLLTSYRAVPKVLRANGFSYEFRDLEPGLRNLLGQGRT